MSHDSQFEHRDDYKELDQGYYLIGTTAYHKLGDISRPDGDLCRVYSETDDFYIGSWITGFGFVNVQFPKDSVRELDQEDIDKWSGRAIAINSNPPHYQFSESELKEKIPTP